MSKIAPDAPTVEQLRAQIPESVRGFARRPDDCHHPINRRIGTLCAACGKENVK